MSFSRTRKARGRSITVVSLFDGISCGREALRHCGMHSSNLKYYASEIDANAIKVATSRHPDIIQVGDVTHLKYQNGTLVNKNSNDRYRIGKVHLLLAGSPCQGFSSNGDLKLFNDSRSSLYFEFERLLQELQPTYFLLENVAMPSAAEAFINKRLSRFGAQLHKINSKDWSAQNRPRLYWTNIPTTAANRLNWQMNKQNRIPRTMKAIIGKGYEGIYHRPHGYYKGGFKVQQEKGSCITRSGWLGSFFVHQNGVRRKFRASECEQMQTLPIGYTDSIESEHMRVALIGNAWTVSVISALIHSILT